MPTYIRTISLAHRIVEAKVTEADPHLPGNGRRYPVTEPITTIIEDWRLATEAEIALLGVPSVQPRGSGVAGLRE